MRTTVERLGHSIFDWKIFVDDDNYALSSGSCVHCNLVILICFRGYETIDTGTINGFEGTLFLQLSKDSTLEQMIQEVLTKARARHPELICSKFSSFL